jgi:hypothetical protein
MTDAEARRGAVIGAAIQFMDVLARYQGPTKDWPIRIVCDDQRAEAQFEYAHAALVEALENLKPCERS